MNANFVLLVSQELTPSLLGGFAASLGEKQDIIERACNSAVSALLEGIADLAATEDGAKKLADAVGLQDAHGVETFRSTVGGSAQCDLVEDGLVRLCSLFGRQPVSALADAIERFSTLNQNAGMSLIGFLGALVLRMLRKRTEEEGSDVPSLARFLTSQEDHITAAMPAGFKPMLNSAGFPGTVGLDIERFRPIFQPHQPKPACQDQQLHSGSRLVWLLAARMLASAAWWILGNQPANADRNASASIQAKATAGVWKN